ncbi:MAG: hypothetical protein MUF52_08670 [Syntrophobacteraceae bacterium]|jgi:hypothetical protein|nr:hypothetical protein [Syntrophobacteraceae bacterium]
MKTAKQTPAGSKRGLAGLFDEGERKELFRKYIYFLGWVEVLIFIVAYLYQLGDTGVDQVGSVERGFPWKTYFFVAFIVPVAITFLLGMVIAGFNKYLADGDRDPEDAAPDSSGPSRESTVTRLERLQKVVVWVQRLPFLALLALVGLSAGFIYKLDSILSFLEMVGERSVRVLLISGAVVLGIASIFGFILIILNYQLRKQTMSYEYRSEVAERFGLIILDDHTVLNSEGKLLVQGRQWKSSVPLLSASSEPASGQQQPVAMARRVDLETT